MAETGEGEEYLFKIVVIGDSAVGKSNLLSRFARERFRAVTSAYYRGAVGALLVYDITRRPTYDSIKCWLDELNTHCDTTVARMLVGNKCDSEDIRDASAEESKTLAEEEGLFFIETSALNSTNVSTAFEIVIRAFHNNISKKVLNSDSYKANLSVNRVTLVNNGQGLSRIGVLAVPDMSDEANTYLDSIFLSYSYIDSTVKLLVEESFLNSY